jgi:hypothetical protein
MIYSKLLTFFCFAANGANTVLGLKKTVIRL